MADVNSLTYLLYSVLALAGHDAPTTDPTLRAWEVDSEYPVTKIWDQQPFDNTVNYDDDRCPAGEIYDVCKAGCQGTCENGGRPVVCPRRCVPGCVCYQPGAVRGPDGTCIPPPMCPSAIEPPVTRNAEDDREPPVTRRRKHDREPPVTRRAEDDREPPVTRSAEDDREPPVTRYAEDYRDDEYSCPAGEAYSDCDAGCQGTCENVEPVICPRMCIPGCVCDEPGTVRGPDGTCIPAPLCPSAIEPPVTRYAEDDREPPVTRYAEDDREPPVTRYAEDDREPPVTRRSEDDREPPVTRRPKHYKNPPVTRLAEDDRDDVTRYDYDHTEGADQWPTRSAYYEDKTEEPSDQYPATKVDPFQIYHAEQNPQIHGDQCPKLEEISCKKFCEKNCDNMDRKEIPCPKFCVRGCICKQGYVRGPDGRCIEPKKCPKNSVVSHQEPQPEIDRRCPPNRVHRKCENLDICTEECVCKPGFVEGRHGSCIKPQHYLLPNDDHNFN